jgi:hypothetical protein
VGARRFEEPSVGDDLGVSITERAERFGADPGETVELRR